MGIETHCTVCSERITGDPLVELTAEWPTAGIESQTICSPDCLDMICKQWTDYAREQS